jgi:hypothetical protein
VKAVPLEITKEFVQGDAKKSTGNKSSICKRSENKLFDSARPSFS